MAARAPRRMFASPFVVTLAAAPACYTKAQPPPQPPPSAIEPANPQPDPPAAAEPPPPIEPPDFQPPPPPTAVNANPPTTPLASVEDQQASWTIYRGKDGCMAAIKVGCPTGEAGKPMPACNPPPAFRVECPTGLSLDRPITVITFGSSCAVEPEPIHCPPHAACNPPRPRTVPCPKP